MKYIKRYSHFSPYKIGKFCTLLYIDDNYYGIYFSNGKKWHNDKGAAVINNEDIRYYIDDKYIGNQNLFKSNKVFRKYLKLIAFQ